MRFLSGATLSVIACLSAFPGVSLAADVKAPVKAVMDATVANWAGGDSDWQDIFDAAKLPQLYSKDFIAKYQAAATHPAVDGDGVSPFDYDVIVGGQDACPLEDLSITPQKAAANGTTEVIVRFKKSTCMGKDPSYQDYTTVRFNVIEEGGKPVIDDIISDSDEGDHQPVSLKDEMSTISKGG